MGVTETPMDPEQLLKELAEVSGTIVALENRRTELVNMARALGTSWITIGEAMRVSKQAAWERYAQ